MKMTPKKELEIRDIRQRLNGSLHASLQERDGAIKIRLKDYPNLTLQELADEIEMSGHSITNISETYLTLNWLH